MESKLLQEYDFMSKMAIERNTVDQQRKRRSVLMSIVYVCLGLVVLLFIFDFLMTGAFDIVRLLTVLFFPLLLLFNHRASGKNIIPTMKDIPMKVRLYEDKMQYLYSPYGKTIRLYETLYKDIRQSEYIEYLHSLRINSLWQNYEYTDEDSFLHQRNGRHLEQSMDLNVYLDEHDGNLLLHHLQDILAV